jgi:hypothetical protein
LPNRRRPLVTLIGADRQTPLSAVGQP